MSNTNCKPNKDDWRNSTEPYTILLDNSNYIFDEAALSFHIDSHTLQYKQWDNPTLELLSDKDGILEFSNSNYKVRYLLTVRVESNQLHVSCDCIRKVEDLCHHVYHALLHIITQYGIQYFKPKF